MSQPRPLHPVPTRHVVPGLVVFAAFIGLSVAGQARLAARQPPVSFDLRNEGGTPDPDELFDPEEFLAPEESVAAPARQLIEEAGDLGEPEERPASPSPVVQQVAVQQEAVPRAPEQAPVEPPRATAPTDQAAGVLVGLEAALAGLDSAGREPGKVMVAVQEARARLQQVEKDLKALRGAPVPGLNEAQRAHGRLTRASFELDSAARQALGAAPSAMGDPFALPKRLVDESRVRVAAARRAMQAER